MRADLAALCNLGGQGQSDIHPSKTSQLEERLNGLVDLLRASGEFPSDGSRTRQSSSSQFGDEAGAYMCSTRFIFPQVLTLTGISFVARALPDLVQRCCKCYTHTSVLQPTCSPPVYLSSSDRRCSPPETLGRGAAGHLSEQAHPRISIRYRRAGRNTRASQG